MSGFSWRIQWRWQTQQMAVDLRRATQHFRRWLAIAFFCAARSEFYEAHLPLDPMIASQCCCSRVRIAISLLSSD